LKFTAALSAKQGSILKGLVDTKANSTGNNSIAFNVAVATSDNNAVNKGQPGAVNGMVAPAGNPSLILLTT
jgi:hypothetical protein